MACTLLVSAHSVALDNRILILGDSISAAYGIELEQGWVKLLENELAGKFGGVSVVNASISGETSDGVRRRLPALLARYQPRWVVVEIGGNDGLRGYPLTGLKENLASIIDNALVSNAEVLLLGMQIPPNYGRRYTDSFSAIYPELAQRFDIPLVPFFLVGVAGDPELMQDDGIHPTAAAQSILLDNVRLPLMQLLAPVVSNGGQGQ